MIFFLGFAADLDDETFKQIMRIFSSCDFRYSYFEIATRFCLQIDVAVVVVLAVVVGDSAVGGARMSSWESVIILAVKEQFVILKFFW